MKPAALVLLGLLALPLAVSAGTPANLQQACSTDLPTYCASVSKLSKSRQLACLYAHEDRLTGACRYAMFDGITELASALNRIDAMKKACDADVGVHCGRDASGQFDLNTCLAKSYKYFSQECQRMVDSVDPKHN